MAKRCQISCNYQMTGIFFVFNFLEECRPPTTPHQSTIAYDLVTSSFLSTQSSTFPSPSVFSSVCSTIVPCLSDVDGVHGILILTSWMYLCLYVQCWRWHTVLTAVPWLLQRWMVTFPSWTCSRRTSRGPLRVDMTSATHDGKETRSPQRSPLTLSKYGLVSVDKLTISHVAGS